MCFVLHSCKIYTDNPRVRIILKFNLFKKLKIQKKKKQLYKFEKKFKLCFNEKNSDKLLYKKKIYIAF